MQLGKSTDDNTKYTYIVKMPLQYWVMDSAVLEVYIQCYSACQLHSNLTGLILDFVNKHYLFSAQLGCL